MPGGDVNPYLAVAALIAAGLHGIENELSLEDGFAGNAYTSGADRCRPRCVRRGGLWKGSEVAAAAFGDEVVDHYANNARVELAAFDARGHGLGAVPRLRTLSSEHTRGKPIAEFSGQPGDRGGRRGGADGERRGGGRGRRRAQAAYEAWRAVAPGDRARLLRDFAPKVEDHIEELADSGGRGAGHPSARPAGRPATSVTC